MCVWNGAGEWAEPTDLEHVGGAVVGVLHHHGLGPGQRVGDAVLLLVTDGLQRKMHCAVNTPPPASVRRMRRGGGARGVSGRVGGAASLTLAACGVHEECTVLGRTPLALFLRHRAKRLLRRPLSPLGSEPLHLRMEGAREGSRGQGRDLLRTPRY